MWISLLALIGFAWLQLGNAARSNNTKFLRGSNSTGVITVPKNQAENVSKDDISDLFVKREVLRNTSDGGGQKPLQRVRKSAVTVLATDRCPGGTTYNDRCFWSGGSRTWDQCESHCSGQGWRMICVDSATTNTFLLSTFPGNQFFTIGLNNKANAGSYVWSGGCSPPGYRNWDTGQPNSGSERCAVFAASGKWHDVVCNGAIACGCESSWTFEPTAYPTKNPTNNPTKDPTKNPTQDPTKDPTRNPTVNPTVNPTAYPTFTPTCVPTSQPSRQPSSQPSRQPSGQPSGQPSRQPTLQPSAQPSARPTSQPSKQPSSRPSTQPSSSPSGQPSAQPSVRPSVQPSAVPSVQPTSQPSSEPSGQPSTQPSALPSVQPSSQPSHQPSMQPSSQPSVQPSSTPSSQPSAQPSGEPSGQPSNQPSMQPSTQPSNQPSTQPSAQPSTQPSGEPTSQPSMQPSGEPTSQPSAQPSTQPSVQPSGQPTVQPSAQPSSQPSCQPTGEPTSQPSMQPSAQPSVQPSGEPSSQPSVQPSTQPSTQPSSQPSGQPSNQPSDQPTAQPSSQPSAEPTSQPTACPSSQPSAQPSVQPSAQPTTQPSGWPSAQPSRVPSSQPSAQPSDQPSAQPSSEPSSQPTMQPSGEPTSQPSMQPSSQPSLQPSHQPAAVPTSQPTCAPSELPTSEWATTLHQTPPFRALSAHDGNVWTCSDEGQCVLIDAINGAVLSQFGFESSVYSVLGMLAADRVVVSGSFVSLDGDVSDVAQCTVQPRELSCEVTSFEDTSFTAASYVSHFHKLVHIGQYNMFLSATIFNIKQDTAETYVYTMYNLKSVVLSHIVSPPKYVGGFVAGTGVRRAGAPVNYILFGKLRTDNGVLTAVYLAPAIGSILNSAELVNAMALESVNADSFIAGGLEMSDGAGMHAYVVRASGLYTSVLYCVRYRVHRSSRRALTGATTAVESVAKSVVVVNELMFVTVDFIYSGVFPYSTAVTVLQSDAITGNIHKQVNIAAPNGSFTCSEITYTGYYLTLLCSLQRTNNASSATAVVISVDTELTFKWLPAGLIRSDIDLFVAEQVALKKNTLTITSAKANIVTTKHSYRTFNALSDQPSSSPTAAPTVSPQPTSQPSTSGPTNTKKPLVEPTQRPSASPTSAAPSKGPTPAPTARPSTTRTAAPSRTRKPTRAPTTHVWFHTAMPSIASEVVVGSFERSGLSLPDTYLMDLIMACVGAMVGFIVCLLCMRWCLQCSLHTVEKDKRRMLCMTAFNAPAVPEYPILSAIVKYLLSLEDEPGTLSPVTAISTGDSAEVTQTTMNTTSLYSNRGAYAVACTGKMNDRKRSASDIREENMVTNWASHSNFKNDEAVITHKRIKRPRRNTINNDASSSSNSSVSCSASNNSSEEDVVLSEESVYSSLYSSDIESNYSYNTNTEGGSVIYSISTGNDYISECSSATIPSVSAENTSASDATLSSENELYSNDYENFACRSDSYNTSSSVYSDYINSIVYGSSVTTAIDGNSVVESVGSGTCKDSGSSSDDESGGNIGSNDNYGITNSSEEGEEGFQ